MPYIVTSAKYPSHIATEVGKKYLEALQKFPLGEGPGELIIPAATRGTTEGVRVFSVTKVKDEEFMEAWKRIGDMLVLFLEIEGFEYTVEYWLETQDALELVGMKLP